MQSREKQIEAAVDTILADYGQGRDIDQICQFCHPDKAVVIDIVQKLHRLLYPGYSRDKNYRIYNARHNLSMLMEDVLFHLSRQAGIVLGDEEKGKDLCLAFFAQLPQIRALLQTDLQAAFDGDPAALNKEEVILSYPGLYAISIYRLAHALYELGLPLIPRMMTEHAHSLTGIDIHPGATVGAYFFIDHGTGIVIGETTVIGEGVKIYQGVTLGGLSTRGGQRLRGKKRHPTIGDRVTIYANATILGGDTVIGRDCVIGAGVFITESVAPETTVTTQAQQLQYNKNKR